MGKLLLKKCYHILTSLTSEIYLSFHCAIMIWFHMLHFYEPIFILLGILIYMLWQNQNKLNWLFLFCTIGTLIIHLPSQEQPPIKEKEYQFDAIQRIGDVKSNEKTKSFIAFIENQKYIVFAPSHFEIGMRCLGGGDVKNITPQGTSIDYYFQSQKITKQIVLKTLSCQQHFEFSFQYIRDLIHSSFQIYGNTGELYFTLLFGGGSGTTLIDTSIWQTLGIIHFISLSGLQVSLILSVLSKVYLFFPIAERIQKWLNTLFLLAYGCLCITSVSFIRIIFVKLCEQWGIDTHRFTLQYGSTLLFLLIWPECYFNVGFWFSILMQITLIYNSTLCTKYRMSKKQQFLLQSSLLFLQTIIISTLYKLTISPFFLLTNALFIPFFEYILLPILLCGIMILPIQEHIVYILNNVNLILEISTYYMQNRVSNHFEATIAYVSIIASIAASFTHQKLRYVIACMILPTLIITSSLVYMPRVIHDTLIFLDVGQGDSSIIFLAEPQKLILIDTGPPNEYYINKLKKYIYRLGKTHIDYLIITHEDQDHAGNAVDVLQNVEIMPNVLLLPNTRKSEKLLSLERAHKKETQYVDKESQSIYKDDKRSISILNPGYHLENENEESIVLQLTIGQNKIVYQADAGKAFERVGSQQIPELTLLKVAHHGSQSGSGEAYIQQVKPKYSIISAAQNNRYGHPHKDVTQILESVQTTLLQTQQIGDISFQCNMNNCYQIDQFML